VLRLGWPVVILFTLFVVLVARRPGLVFTRGFFPVLVVMGILLLVGYRRRDRNRPRD
jgi:hypothetical protein